MAPIHVARRTDRNFWLLVGDGGLFSLAIVCFDASIVFAGLRRPGLCITAADRPASSHTTGRAVPAATAVRHFQHIKPFFFWQAAVGRAALGGEITPSTFVWLFGWGCAAFLVSVVCIGLVREHRDTPRPSLDEPPLSHIKSLVRGGPLLRMGIAQVLAGSLQLALPFYVLFARDAIGLGGEWVGSFIVAHTVGASIAALAWARLAERYGARLVIRLSAALLIAMPLLAMAAGSLRGGVLLLLLFLVAGAARGGSQAGFWQYVLDLVPARDRRVFMGLANTANAPTLLMPVIGAALLAWGGFMWLFAASVVLGVLASIAGASLPRPGAPVSADYGGSAA